MRNKLIVIISILLCFSEETYFCPHFQTISIAVIFSSPTQLFRIVGVCFGFPHTNDKGARASRQTAVHSHRALPDALAKERKNAVDLFQRTPHLPAQPKHGYFALSPICQRGPIGFLEPKRRNFHTILRRPERYVKIILKHL